MPYAPPLSPSDLERLADFIADKLDEKQRNRPGLVDGLELAEICHVSLATIERLKARVEIPFIQFGARIKFDPEKVVAALEQKAQRQVGDSRS
jgi:hypothetical protein